MKKICFILFLPLSANSALLVEPYVGYQFGSLDLGAEAVSANGTSLGARGGLVLGEAVFLAADTRFASIRVLRSQVPDQGATQFEFGLVAGVKIPAVPLRLWAGLGLLNHLSQAEQPTFKGDSLKIGAGYQVAGDFYINAEYLSSDFSTGETRQATRVPAQDSIYLSMSYAFGMSG